MSTGLFAGLDPAFRRSFKGGFGEFFARPFGRARTTGRKLPAVDSKIPTRGGNTDCGEVAERLIAPVLKTGVPARGPRVRIPPSPPAELNARELARH